MINQGSVRLQPKQRLFSFFISQQLRISSSNRNQSGHRGGHAFLRSHAKISHPEGLAALVLGEPGPELKSNGQPLTRAEPKTRGFPVTALVRGDRKGHVCLEIPHTLPANSPATACSSGCCGPRKPAKQTWGPAFCSFILDGTPHWQKLLWLHVKGALLQFQRRCSRKPGGRGWASAATSQALI